MSSLGSDMSGHLVVAITWRLLCSSFLGGRIQPLRRKQVIPKKELDVGRNLQT